MNASPNPSSGMELPPPVMESAPADTAIEGKKNGAEQAPAGAERAPQASGQPAAATSPLSLPLPPTLPTTPPPVGVSTTTKSDDATAADDKDLIEKEWVSRAKAIVERTREDPYRQSEELTEVKADYLKKRFNKSIKLSK